MRRMDEDLIRIWSGNIRAWAGPDKDGKNAWIYRVQLMLIYSVLINLT